jgi:phosphoribosylamine--glycine ligase
MGAYAPLDWAPSDLVQQVQSGVLDPVLAEMRARGCPFSGLLYAGLVLTSAGPKVIEFNCRFGDPETQVVLELLDSPLGELLGAAAAGDLRRTAAPTWKAESAVTVVIAAQGYPGQPMTGDVITGSEQDGVLHAGTRRDDTGRVVSSGGRVLSVTATGADLTAARSAAYTLAGGVGMRGAQYRTDIGAKAAAGLITVPTPERS